MRKKIVVKLLAVVMAMTMVLGSGMTVFAAESLTEAEADALFEEHINNCENVINSYGIGQTKTHCVVMSEKEIRKIDYFRDSHSYEQFVKSTSSYDSKEQMEQALSGIEALNVGDILFYYKGYMSSFWKMCQKAPQNQTATSTSKVSTPKVTPEQLAEEAYNAAYWANQVAMSQEAALPVSTFASEGAVDAIPAEAKASGAAYNLSAVTSSQGFAAAVNKLSAETTNASLAVYSSKMITFTSELLDEIEKTGKTFEYTFELEGHIYKITIPAGAKVDMDGQRFVGPLYIGAQLGTSQVIK